MWACGKYLIVGSESVIDLHHFKTVIILQFSEREFCNIMLLGNVAESELL